mmetsp:Transcript_16753/g.40094  ORF Transcript_16753/g.40094 Transcript_16753/m.40094 type:complete len:309 (-) Transcript_16753:159-1085(-)
MGCGSSQEAGPGALSEDEIRTVLTVELVVNSLSIIGSSFIIACWIFFPSLRKFAFTLVLYLSISDVMGGFAALLSPGDDTCGATCLFQAYLVSIFGLSSVLWTACIGHCLYRAICHHDVEVQRFEYRYHVFSWGVPLLLALAPQLSNSYGKENGRCWILKDHPALRFIQFYVPLWLVVGYNGAMYWRILATLRAIRTNNPESKREEVKMLRGLGLYPAVLVVCWLFASLNRVQNSLSPGHPSFTLFCLHRLFGGSQGLLNCLVYGLNASVRNKLRHAVCGGRGEGEEGDGKSEVQLALAAAPDPADDF